MIQRSRRRSCASCCLGLGWIGNRSFSTTRWYRESPSSELPQCSTCDQCTCWSPRWWWWWSGNDGRCCDQLVGNNSGPDCSAGLQVGVTIASIWTQALAFLWYREAVERWRGEIPDEVKSFLFCLTFSKLCHTYCVTFFWPNITSLSKSKGGRGSAYLRSYGFGWIFQTGFAPTLPFFWKLSESVP